MFFKNYKKFLFLSVAISFCSVYAMEENSVDSQEEADNSASLNAAKNDFNYHEIEDSTQKLFENYCLEGNINDAESIFARDSTKISLAHPLLEACTGDRLSIVAFLCRLPTISAVDIASALNREYADFYAKDLRAMLLVAFSCRVKYFTDEEIKEMPNNSWFNLLKYSSELKNEDYSKLNLLFDSKQINQLFPNKLKSSDTIDSVIRSEIFSMICKYFDNKSIAKMLKDAGEQYEPDIIKLIKEKKTYDINTEFKEDRDKEYNIELLRWLLANSTRKKINSREYLVELCLEEDSSILDHCLEQSSLADLAYAFEQKENTQKYSKDLKTKLLSCFYTKLQEAEIDLKLLQTKDHTDYKAKIRNQISAESWTNLFCSEETKREDFAELIINFGGSRLKSESIMFAFKNNYTNGIIHKLSRLIQMVGAKTYAETISIFNDKYKEDTYKLKLIERLNNNRLNDLNFKQCLQYAFMYNDTEALKLLIDDCDDGELIKQNITNITFWDYKYDSTEAYKVFFKKFKYVDGLVDLAFKLAYEHPNKKLIKVLTPIANTNIAKEYFLKSFTENKTDIAKLFIESYPDIIGIDLLNQCYDHANSRELKEIALNQIRKRSPAYEVHVYSDSKTKAKHQGQELKQKDAVFQHIKKHIEEKNLCLHTIEEAQAIVSSAIEKYIPETLRKDAREAAFFKIESDTEYNYCMRLIVTYLNSISEEYMRQWIDGFVHESIEAYKNSKNKTSCEKGIKERLLTGLRGINEKLDKVFFAKAEGTILMNNWLNIVCRFGQDDIKKGESKEAIERQKENIAKELAAHIKAQYEEASDEDIANAFAVLAKNKLSEYSLEKNEELLDKVELFKDLMEGSLADKIKPYLKPYLQKN